MPGSHFHILPDLPGKDHFDPFGLRHGASFHFNVHYPAFPARITSSCHSFIFPTAYPIPRNRPRSRTESGAMLLGWHLTYHSRSRWFSFFTVFRLRLTPSPPSPESPHVSHRRLVGHDSLLFRSHILFALALSPFFSVSWFHLFTPHLCRRCAHAGMGNRWGFRPCRYCGFWGLQFER